jgi:hypothetical protein
MASKSDAAAPTSTIARACNVEGYASADRDPACFPVLPDDSSRIVTEKGAECSTSTPPKAADVETALARALDAAATAGRFDVVAQLARELEARRLAGMRNVVNLPTEHKLTQK